MPLDHWINNILEPIINKYQHKSIEQVLKNSSQLLDFQTWNEIKEKSLSFISNDGGFCDRSGKSDLYYSLFGMYVYNALNISKINENLKSYLNQFDLSTKYEGVYLYCLSILHSKLFTSGDEVKYLRKQIKEIVNNGNQLDYTIFLGLLSLYYQKDYLTIYKLLRKFKPNIKDDVPCTVLAAKAFILKASGKNVKGISQKLMEFYRGNGSFSALKNSPVGDLLSTAVALFALYFINADIRTIKPDCLEYIDSLYNNGSFRATNLDFETDIEYTFYGLLALGSLA
jgi:hypothetical protein